MRVYAGPVAHQYNRNCGNHFAFCRCVPLDFASLSRAVTASCARAQSGHQVYRRGYNALVALFTPAVICDSRRSRYGGARSSFSLLASFSPARYSFPVQRLFSCMYVRMYKKGSQRNGNLSPANSRLSPRKRIFRSSYGAEKRAHGRTTSVVNGGNLRPGANGCERE